MTQTFNGECLSYKREHNMKMNWERAARRDRANWKPKPDTTELKWPKALLKNPKTKAAKEAARNEK